MSPSLPIDVVVPAYNAAPYLLEALTSIARQTRSVQRVIVVDDGSKDDTAAIAHSFGATVLSVANGGVAAARNIGIRASSAPYIALLDADDRWHPERIETQWAAHEVRPDVMMITSDYVALEDGIAGKPVLAAHVLFNALASEPLTVDSCLIRRSAILGAVAVRNFILPSSMLLDRRLFDECGVYYLPRGRLPETDAILVGEDYEWLLRVLRHTDVAFVKRVLVDYRMVATSLSARRGRIRYGDVVLSRLVAASPDSYAVGAADLLQAMRPRMLLEAALAHARGGEFMLCSSRLEELVPGAPLPKRVAIALARFVFERRAFYPILTWLAALRRPGWARAKEKRT